MGMYDEDVSIGRGVGAMDKRASDFPTEHANVYRDRGRDVQEPSDARILSQIEYMTDQLSKTRALLGELEEALEPILIPQFEDTTATSIDVPRKMASSVSNLLDDRNGDIQSLQRRIQQIRGRIQL